MYDERLLSSQDKNEVVAVANSDFKNIKCLC